VASTFRKTGTLDFRIGHARLFLNMSFQPIENYGVIGNMRSVALVGMDGSIDFLCYPDFDSPTVFAALLDDKQGGCFQIEPQLTDMRIWQLYLPDTNTLLTRFLAEEGVAELTDFMRDLCEAEERAKEGTGSALFFYVCTNVTESSRLYEAALLRKRNLVRLRTKIPSQKYCFENEITLEPRSSLRKRRWIPINVNPVPR
jgi:hypothetical protein